jgi:hypothetical protein
MLKTSLDIDIGSPNLVRIQNTVLWVLVVRRDPLLKYTSATRSRTMEHPMAWSLRTTLKIESVYMVVQFHFFFMYIASNYLYRSVVSGSLLRGSHVHGEPEACLALLAVANRLAVRRSLGAFDLIPLEMLEKVIAFLDVRTLCTARLVCTSFLPVASSCVHTLTLSAGGMRSFPETIFSRFPKVMRVTICNVKLDDDLPLLGRPHIRDAVTYMVVAHAPSSAILLPLPEFRNLTSLAFVNHLPPNRFALPTTLKELVLDWPAPAPPADDLNRLTRLTSLRIAVIPIVLHPPGNPGTFLSALHKLDITCHSLLIPRVQEWTQLTHLTWESLHVPGQSWFNDLSPFTHLQGLVYLGIKAVNFCADRDCFMGLTRMPALRSLDLMIDRAHQPFCWGRLPAGSLPLLPLTHLGLSLGFMCLGVLPRMVAEGLESLSLTKAFFLEDNEIRGLGQATGLTRLEVLMDSGIPYHTRPCLFHEAVSGMSRLQALSVHTGESGISCPLVVVRLTGLTQLRWAGVHVSNADIAACARLKGLRELSLSADPYTKTPPPAPITSNAFEALARLPQLTWLELSQSLGIRAGPLSEEARARLPFNAGRHARGWPSLEVTSGYWFEYRKGLR